MSKSVLPKDIYDYKIHYIKPLQFGGARHINNLGIKCKSYHVNLNLIKRHFCFKNKSSDFLHLYYLSYNEFVDHCFLQEQLKDMILCHTCVLNDYCH